MNPIEQIFYKRDQLVEQRKLSIILPEEELKKHNKDAKMHPQEVFQAPPYRQGGIISQQTTNKLPERKDESNKKLPSLQIRQNIPEAKTK